MSERRAKVKGQRHEPDSDRSQRPRRGSGGRSVSVLFSMSRMFTGKLHTTHLVIMSPDNEPDCWEKQQDHVDMRRNYRR